MDTWTTIKVAFSVKASNRQRFKKLLPLAVTPLEEVRMLLVSPGAETVPEDRLADLAERWAELDGLLHAARALSRAKPGPAFKQLFKIVEPARTLLTTVKVEVEAAKRIEAERREHERAFSERLDIAKGHLRIILDSGGVRPEPITTNLEGFEALLNRRHAVDQYDQARAKVDEMVSDPLIGLATQMARAGALKRRVPADLPKGLARSFDQLFQGVTVAVRDGQVAVARAAVEALKEFIVPHILRDERDRALQPSGRPDPRDAYQRLQLKIRDILDYPSSYASRAVRRQQKSVRRARRKVRTRLALLDEAERDLQETASDADPGQLFARMDVEAALEDTHKALDALKQALADAVRPLADHDAELRRYYAALKTLKPRVTFANAQPTQEDGVDTPWKAQRLDFDKALAAVKAAVDPPKRRYKEGRALLRPLEEAIDALSAARTAALNADIDAATDATHGSARKTKALVDTLAETPGLIAEMKPEQQLKVLEGLRTQLWFCNTCDHGFDHRAFRRRGNRCPNTLADGATACNSTDVDIPAVCNNEDCRTSGLFTRTNPCPDCGSTRWTVTRTIRARFSNGKPSPNRDLLVTRAKMFSEMKLTPAFEEHDQKKRRETIAALREDKLFAEAREHWATWVKDNNTAKIEAFFNQAIRIQCRILGHDQKGLTRTRDGTTHHFPDVPVKVRLDTPDPPKPHEYGHCEAGFPTWISINTTNRQFGDFKEQVDTIVHENAHAFQHMLTRKLRPEDPFDDSHRDALLHDPALGMQARLFLENEKSYVKNDTLNADDAERAMSRRAYRHEPLEEHAWSTGGTISSALLVPPQIESFSSKDTLRSRIWFVQEVSRASLCTLTLAERHGLYVGEWEGEQASDKQLTLENIKKGNKLQSVRVRIRQVIDAYTLELTLDTRSYDPLRLLSFDHLEHPSKVLEQGIDVNRVAGESIRLILHERASDL
ncbi:MAG: hypothetical protein H6739_35250 [Alphaproteobacteria bacterium]|nr:hypothetical protein [Alphaproteobacteria bacterium]